MQTLLKRPCIAVSAKPKASKAVLPFRAYVVRAPVLRGAASAAAGAAPAAPAAVPKKADAAPAHWQLVAAELVKPKREKLTVVSVAPAVRVAISEALGLAPGAVTPGQLVAGLRRLGFTKVFDTNLAADLTIMEEGTELLHRLADHLEGHPKQEEPMPMFTSCCPGWIQMVEKSYPELIPYLSSCKSPQMMMGAVIKNFFAEEAGVKPGDIISCSVMPCVRKQGEADRPMMTTTAEGRDVDHVITTVELAQMLTERGIDLTSLPDEEFDCPLGIGSGGGQLFGTTGGVMEAALRTVVELVSGQPMGRIVFEDVRGLEGIKAATITLQPAANSPFAKYNPEGKGLDVRIAVANGLGNAKKLITEMKAGTSKYDFIEVMACPSGCIGGGGQPRSADKQILQKRQQAIYTLDERAVIRRSHENPIIAALYKRWLQEPCSETAHHLLHTHYVAGGPAEAQQEE
uniref:Plastid FeFe-hydrogenase n=1 Tax=Chlamydomonas moewusii TaxID=3054 RepID=Q56UD8_CHLMO|nr:plastid FeFe-hydrogenase precursor [Chlamydomonas moewusii]